MTAAPSGALPPVDVTVWVVATEKVLAEKNSAAQLGTQLVKLQEHHSIANRYSLPNVTVW